MTRISMLKSFKVFKCWNRDTRKAERTPSTPCFELSESLSKPRHVKWNEMFQVQQMGIFFFRLFNWKMSGKHYSFISMALSGTFISWYFLSSFDMRLDSDIPEWCEVMSIYCEYWGNKGFKYVVSVMRHQ